jgi:hypothetical protein
MSKLLPDTRASVTMGSNGWCKVNKYKQINILQLQERIEFRWSSMESYGANDSTLLQGTPNGLQGALELQETENRLLNPIAPSKGAYTDALHILSVLQRQMTPSQWTS